MLMIVITGKIIQNCTNNTTEDKIHILIQLDGNVQLIVFFYPRSNQTTGRSVQLYPCTGRAWLIRSHLSARFCFELSGNSN